MPPPTNTTITTATDLGGSLPVTVMQDQTFSGTTYDLWFSITVPAGVKEIGPWAFGDFSTWNPVLSTWRGPTGAPVQIGNSALSVPMQAAVTAGETIYFKTIKPGGVVTPAVTTLTIEAAPNLAVPVGSILVNDSSDGFPLVAINSQVTQTLLNFYHPFPAGECCKVLTTGEVCVADDFGANGPVIYGPQLPPVVQSTPVMPATGYLLNGTDQTTGWWAGKDGGASHATAVFIAKNGTVSATVHDLGSPGLKSLTPNLADTVLYFIQNTASSNQPVKKCTLAGDVITTFVAGAVGFSLSPGITTMLNDHVLVGYNHLGTSCEVREFDTAGTLVHTFALGANNNVEHIFTAIDDPNSFWVWTTHAGVNTYQNIKISTGAVLHSVQTIQFVQGVSQESASATPTNRFGSDFSCDPWIARNPQVLTHTYLLRRQRRFLLPSSENNYTMQIPVIELLMRTGIGLKPDGLWDGTTPYGVDPLVRIRLSKDGGKTWGPETRIPAGRRGEYLDRVRLLQATGNYRNAVLEVTVDAPVDWQWIAAMGNPVEGSS